VVGRPFVKRFALCYQTVVCPVCLSVCLSVLSVTSAYCGQTVGWIKMKLGNQVDLGTGHIVLYGDPASLPPRKGHCTSLFLAHVYCGYGRPFHIALSSCLILATDIHATAKGLSRFQSHRVLLHAGFTTPDIRDMIYKKCNLSERRCILSWKLYKFQRVENLL